MIHIYLLGQEKLSNHLTTEILCTLTIPVDMYKETEPDKHEK